MMKSLTGEFFLIALKGMSRRQKENFLAILCTYNAFKSGQSGIANAIEVIDPDLPHQEPELYSYIQHIVALDQSEILRLVIATALLLS